MKEDIKRLSNEIMKLQTYASGTVFYKFRYNENDNFCLELDKEEINLLIEHKKQRLKEIKKSN